MGILIPIIYLLVCTFKTLNGALIDDKIQNLPGLNFVLNFNQYSGYLNASNGTFLHYWFVESQSKPATDPVIVWFNGGPGCSSLIGLLTENGPFRLAADAMTVIENPYAWNKIANVLYIESPSMVGFSYSTHPNASDWTDIKTGIFNHNAIRYFFSTVAPQYQNNSLYITGESYGGQYVPQVASLIATDSTFPGNFQGIAVGNGLLSWAMNSQSYFEILYYHGIYSTKQKMGIQTNCCNGILMEQCDIGDLYSPVRGINSTGACRNALEAADNRTAGLDPYNLYYSCYTPSNIDMSDTAHLKQHSSVLEAYARVHPMRESASVCRNPLDDTSSTYLNSPAVRKALNIRTNQSWSSCNYNVNSKFGVQFANVSTQIMTILKMKKKVLIYNGDVDTACNFLGDMWFTEALGLTPVGEYNQWHYRYDAVNIAGYVQRYKEGLDFLTVRGSGHFVPQTHPKECLQMISNFIWGNDYSSPTNISIAKQPLNSSPASPTSTTSTASSPYLHRFQYLLLTFITLLIFVQANIYSSGL